MTLSTTERTQARTLVEPGFCARLTLRIAEANGLDSHLAVRIADQALAYLATSAQRAPGSPVLSPSPMVDLGWHALLEYSSEYDELFAGRGWRKVHHHPHDVPGRQYEPAAVVLARTTRAIEAAGYRVDAELWAATTVSCGGDDSDGKPGDPLPCGDHG
jgi:hypothetical protein